MKHIVSSEQMKAIDLRTINELGIPSRVLMETAGKGCADYLNQHHEEQLSGEVIVFCGNGNNGGDGYVIARWLNFYGYDVTIFTAGSGKMSPETSANRELCEKLKIGMFELEDAADEDVNEYLELISSATTIIDAFYGIGFKGKLKGIQKELIGLANECSAFCVAIDIPSGLDADKGSGKDCFIADLTLAIDALKPGHFFGTETGLCGKVEVISIGIPDEYYYPINAPTLLEDCLALLPIRNPKGNKGDFGRIAVFAGSPGYTGAAFLASMGCLRAGAGLVTIFAHPEQMLHFANKPYEVMVTEIPLTAEGTPDMTVLEAKLARYDLILFGPGIGVSEYSTSLLTHILKNWKKQLVIDADGLNILATHKKLLPLLKKTKPILTPHWGEFCRLADITIMDLESDPIGQAKAFAVLHNVKLLLKSFITIFATSSEVRLCTKGNDGLATGGSGDVLSGLVAGLWVQKINIPWSPLVAAWYLGDTAEKLAATKRTMAITPTEILDNIFKL